MSLTFEETYNCFPHRLKPLIIPAMSVFALALSYWLHLLATVIWLGGVTMLVLATVTDQNSDNPASLPFEALDRRLRPLANVSLAVLLVTGAIQMGGDPHYDGFLAINSPWAVGMLAKHVIVGLIIMIMVIVQGQILPGLERENLRSQHGKRNDSEKLRRRQRRLTTVNFGFGVVVLLLTAIMTALP